MRALVAMALLATTLGLPPTRIEIRVEGYLGASAEEAKPWKMLTVRVGEGEVRPFALTNLVLLSANGPTAAQVVAQVQPYTPSFVFQGEAELLERIRTAEPNERLAITGYTTLGSQWVLVNRVERSAPVTGPTPTPSLREKLLGF